MSNLTRGYDYNTDPKGSVEENCLSLESERNFSVPDGSVNGPQVTWEDYARAERFLPQNIGKLAFRLDITPKWIGKGDCFWYRVNTRDGKQFMYVDPDAGIRKEAFDHVKLAAELSRASNKPYVHNDLPFDEF